VALAMWKAFFDVERFETANHKFALSIRSDGTSLRLHMRKPVASGVPLKLSEYLKKPPEERSLVGKRVGSCDPGRDHTTFHASVDVPDNLKMPRPYLRTKDDSGWDADYNSGFSTREYYDLAGFTSARNLRQKWMDNNKEIRRINKNMPSPKTAEPASLHLYLVFFLNHLGQMLDFYSQHCWRKLRFKSKIGQQRALSKLVERFTQGRKPSDCIIAWGAASFNQSSPGHPTSPNKLIRRMFVSAGVLVNQGVKQKLWGVRSCSTPNCGVTWNRDLNAARNILYLFFYANARFIEGVDRQIQPGHFNRRNN
ncbi:hypothetical protein HDU93_001104, partial [Gonapodya sp. JEL0774]